MRIIIIWQLFIAMIMASTLQLTPQEQTWIEDHPSIDFVGDPDWLPFEAFKKGKYVGIVADLLEAMEEQSNLHFNIIETPSWDASIEMIKSNKAMMISQSQDSNKETGFLFTDSFYSNPIVMVMEHKHNYVSSLYEVRDKTIAMVTTQPYFNVITKAYPHIQFKSVKSVEEGLSMVSTGGCDVFIHTLAQTSYSISHLQLNSVRIVGRTEFNTALGFGVRNDNPLLVSILNKVLHNLKPTTRQEILSKWIYQKYVQRADYTPYWIGLGVLLFILVIAIIITTILLREVKGRKKAESLLQEVNKNLENRIEQELKTRQDQEKILEQQSRAAAMGEMMDAVAHQWKQPLNALSMYGELLNKDFKDGEVDQAYLDDMLYGVNGQIEHMTTTLNEFRNFFRPNKVIKEIDLETSIKSVLVLLKDELLKNAITVELNFKNTIRFHIVENEFKHVILNIINNAKDAFNENDIEKRMIKISALCSGDFIEISICDNAGGIPKKIIDTIFKPNITTKAEGKGTGIGLYMSARIIEKSHGSIYAYNSANGACFSIELNKKILKLSADNQTK